MNVDVTNSGWCCVNGMPSWPVMKKSKLVFVQNSFPHEGYVRANGGTPVVNISQVVPVVNLPGWWFVGFIFECCCHTFFFYGVCHVSQIKNSTALQHRGWFSATTTTSTATSFPGITWTICCTNVLSGESELLWHLKLCTNSQKNKTKKKDKSKCIHSNKSKFVI